jgi:uncharacterized protein (UPF0335 family)
MNQMMLLPKVTRQPPPPTENNDSAMPTRTLLLSAATLCSFWNMTNHLLVVMNVIQNVSVMNVWRGVGLDLVSWTMYATTALVVSTVNSTDGSSIETRDILPATTTERITLAAIIFLWMWNFVAHLRALFLFSSLERLESVAKSVHNNLIGDPGTYGMDHLLVYTQLGNHITVLRWCIERIQTSHHGMAGTLVSMVNQQGSIVIVVPFFATLVVAISIGRWTSSHVDKNNSRSGGKAVTKSSWTLSLQSSHETLSAKLICDCPVCKNQTSFTLLPSLCHVWMSSFEDILKQIERIKKEREQKWQATLEAASKMQGTAMDAAKTNEIVRNKKRDVNVNAEKTDHSSSNNDNALTIDTKNTWRCACKGGFLPPGMLQSFGSAEAMMRMGTGQCYHKQ